MAKARWNRPIHHRSATPVAKFLFVDASSAIHPTHVTLTKANITVIEIGKPWSLPSITCYGLRMVMKVQAAAEAPNSDDRHGDDSICQAMIAGLSQDFAESCGAKSKMLPTLAIKDTQNGDAQIYSILFALPLFPSMNEIARILERFPSAETIIGPTDFFQDLRFLCARADFLDERAESS
jgi:hypothetical protein